MLRQGGETTSAVVRILKPYNLCCNREGDKLPSTIKRVHRAPEVLTPGPSRLPGLAAEPKMIETVEKIRAVDCKLPKPLQNLLPVSGVHLMIHLIKSAQTMIPEAMD